MPTPHRTVIYMIPIGDIDMLCDAISRRYADYNVIPFGILIVDAAKRSMRIHLQFYRLFHA